MSTEESASNPLVKVTYSGQEVSAEEIEFEAEKEGWSVYVLSDGTRIKLKNVVARILRLVGQYKEDGDPLYLVQGSAVISSIVPERLKKNVATDQGS